MADPAARRPGGVRTAAVLLAGAALLAPAVALAPVQGAVLAAGLLLVLLCALFPVAAVAAYVGINPLLAGVERGTVVPLVRLNEALLVPLVAGIALAGAVRWARAGRLLPRAHRLDLVVPVLAVCGSVTPLLWMYARGREITADDLQYAAILWKLALVYGLVRVVVRDDRAARTTLRAAVAGALVVGAIGVLQAVGVGPVIEVLTRLTPPEADGYALDESRATSTLGNPIAYGDVMIYAALAAAALALVEPRLRATAGAAAAALTLCALASGQVSVVVGVAVAALAFAVTTRAVTRAVLGAAAVGAVAFPLLQPVVAARLGSVDPRTGLPTSWTGRYGRLQNLETYFWPEIGSDWNWLFGVRPAARAPGAEAWRDWVYIESGHTWLLWSGGVPLLVATLVLVVAALVTGRRLRAAAGPVARAVGTTLTCATVVLAVLMTFDPHLTLRGGAELFFVLLALAACLDQPPPSLTVREVRETTDARPVTA